MGTDPKITTTLSSKGQLILPKAIRSKRHWMAGTKLIVEETSEGVLLKVASPFVETKPEDVFGCAGYDGPPISIEAMDAAIDKEVRRRHALG
ncbi:MAG: AbrB/MazE/SpoVT family DNA-binding domain-containing protein [Xanthomonadales bacterium]|nr:AbrB/MazE/SpoVT family DNA-binding domain-containing protein [Xanthomonadales bacterium]